jgi:hypothetical protein
LALRILFGLLSSDAAQLQELAPKPLLYQLFVIGVRRSFVRRGRASAEELPTAASSTRQCQPATDFVNGNNPQHALTTHD